MGNEATSKVHLELIEMLRSGNTKSLWLGMSRSEVVEILGVPPEVETYYGGWEKGPDIFKYGSLELFFFEGQYLDFRGELGAPTCQGLCEIKYDTLDPLRLDGALALDPGGFVERLSHTDAEEILNRFQVRFERREFKGFQYFFWENSFSIIFTPVNDLPVQTELFQVILRPMEADSCD